MSTPIHKEIATKASDTFLERAGHWRRGRKTGETDEVGISRREDLQRRIHQLYCRRLVHRAYDPTERGGERPHSWCEDRLIAKSARERDILDPRGERRGRSPVVFNENGMRPFDLWSGVYDAQVKVEIGIHSPPGNGAPHGSEPLHLICRPSNAHLRPSAIRGPPAYHRTVFGLKYAKHNTPHNSI